MGIVDSVSECVNYIAHSNSLRILRLAIEKTYAYSAMKFHVQIYII